MSTDELKNYLPITHFKAGLGSNGAELTLDILGSGDYGKSSVAHILVPNSAPIKSFIIGAVGRPTDIISPDHTTSYSDLICVFEIGANETLSQIQIPRDATPQDNVFLEIAAHELLPLKTGDKRDGTPTTDLILKVGDSLQPKKGHQDNSPYYLALLPTDNTFLMTGLLTPKARIEFISHGYSSS